jgi:hypothetical protein
MSSYSWKQTILKGVKYFVLFLLPVLIDRFIIQFPELAQLTLGGFLVMVTNFLKYKVGLRIP